MGDELGKKLDTFRPETKLDPELQQELDDALGDMSLEDLVAAEDAPATSAGTTGASPVKLGQVIAVQGEDIFVDLGGKSQGLLSASQFGEDPLPAVGDSIEVTIQGYDNADGLLLLARKGAIVAVAAEDIEVGQIVEGRVVATNTGGLELSVNGTRVFLPVSHIDLQRVEDLKPYINRNLVCKVLETSESGRQIVVSRRAVLQMEAEQAREALLGTLEVGQVLPGVVRTLMPYGAFVDIGGTDGLLHISDMSYARVADPKEIVSEGQEVQVKILKMGEDQKISLGLKQVQPDPWDGAEGKWPADEIVTGRVTRLADFGAFVELTPGVEGLIPISEMSFERRIKHVGEIVQEGDVIKALVLNVDPQRRRISLSLKRVGDDPWVGASARWPVESTVEGIVKRLADFGAFVELTPGVEGLVHISELSDEHVRTVGDVVREGQTVGAKVLSVDEDQRRISLSIKALAASGEMASLAEDAQAAPAKPRPKRKRPLKGGIDAPGGWTTLGNL